MELKAGTYRHFKGGTYEVLFTAKSSENPEEQLVVYKSLDKGGVWVRPLHMFIEHIERDGYVGPRFKYIGHVE
ncbi:DUF1653 domain-containing protein [Candidatus Kaiserbacteria bacterium]|nr:DUF1653 domain-containing protein [Candidatus Kaiserbacteria bacterium]